MLLASSCASTWQSDSIAPPPATERFAVILGQKGLEEDDFAPLDELPSLTLEFSNGGTHDSIGYEFGVSGARDDETVLGVEIESQVLEIYGGIRKEFGDQSVRPFVGLGISAQQISLDSDTPGTTDVDDTVFGGYLHAGIALQVGDGFSFLLDGRALFADDYELGGLEADSQTFSVGIGVGFSL